MSTVLLTGRDGQLGWELERSLAPLGNIVALDRAALDLAQPDSIRTVVRSLRPDIVVNAAAYTAVDRAESEEALAMAVNGVAPEILAEETRRLGALLVHFSTDYVFDGNKTAPYVEEDAPNPLSAYGRSKLAGERAISDSGAAHLIFRTSWVYGLRGRNFLLTMLRLARERNEIKVVDDQIGAPTWCRMLAQASAKVLAPGARGRRGTETRGLYHLSAGGSTSWFGFAERIMAMSDSPARECRVVPISSSAYPVPAARPRNSVLSNEAFSRDWGFTLPAWDEGLRLCLADRAAAADR